MTVETIQTEFPGWLVWGAGARVWAMHKGTGVIATAETSRALTRALTALDGMRASVITITRAS